MADLLTEEERKFVEMIRAEKVHENEIDDVRFLAILDRIAPKPKEYIWAPGFTDFKKACDSVGITEPHLMWGALKDDTYSWYLIRAVELGFLKTSRVSYFVTELGNMWLREYQEWSAGS